MSPAGELLPVPVEGRGTWRHDEGERDGEEEGEREREREREKKKERKKTLTVLWALHGKNEAKSRRCPPPPLGWSLDLLVNLGSKLLLSGIRAHV